MNTKPSKIVVIITNLRGKSVGAFLARGASLSLIIKIGGTAITFGTQIFLARVMGVDHYGVYIYVFTWLNILVMLGKMGCDTLLLRYVAAYQAQAKWGLLRGILQSSNRFTLFASLALSSITALVVWLSHNSSEVELTSTLWVSCAILPVLTLTALRESTLKSIGHPVLAELPSIILHPLILGILVGVLFFQLNQSVDAIAAMSLKLLTVIVCFLISSYFLKHRLPKFVQLSCAQYQYRDWVRVSMHLWLISGMLLILNKTDILMIGTIIGTTKSGIYAVSSRLASSLIIGISAVNTIVAPMISQLYATGQYSKLQQVLTIAARGIFVYTFPVGLVLIYWGKSLLELLDPQFAEGYGSLVILIIGQLVNASSGSVGFLMTMTGHQKEASIGIGISVVLNIILNAILIPIWSIEGAAISTALTTVTWNIFLLIQVRSKINVNPSIFAVLK